MTIQSFQPEQMSVSAIPNIILACIDSKPMKLPKDFEPRDIDILCGRGRGVWDHPGNRQFKVLIEAHVKEFTMARSRADRGVVIASMVDHIRDQGILFVKKDPQTQRWFDIGEYQAREKTSHALRDHICKVSRSVGKQRRVQATTSKKQNIRRSISQQPTILKGLKMKQNQQKQNNEILPSSSSSSLNPTCVNGTTDVQTHNFQYDIPPKSLDVVVVDDDDSLEWSELFPTEVFDLGHLLHQAYGTPKPFDHPSIWNNGQCATKILV